MIGSGSGHTADMNKKLRENKELLKRSSYFGNTKSTPEGLPKIPNRIKQKIRKENKRRDIIRVIITIGLLISLGLFAFLLYSGQW